jgi:hypothetical protein
MIRENSPNARQRLRLWLLAGLATLPITAALAATQYLYDDLGRLVLAANSDGSATVYAHDENGNVATIIQWAASGSVIAGFSPTYGHAGNTLTIYGAGFSATPAQNAVTVGGVTAAVTSATTNQLTTTIPYGATTGPISVTVDGLTATSSQNLTIFLPAIASFSPTLVNPGGTVTVIGANLAREAGTTATVNGNAGTIGSLSNTSLTFAAPSGSSGGPITVSTPYGQATSAGNLTIVPAAINVANVVAHTVLEVGGSTQSASIDQANRYALFEFEAAADQYLSIQLTAFSTNAGSGTSAYTAHSPTGASIASGSVSATNPTIHLPKTTTAGRYLVAFASGSGSSVSISAYVEVATTLSTSAVPLSVPTTRVGESKRSVATLSAGDDLALGITGLVRSPSGSVSFSVYRPGGSLLKSFSCNQSGCSSSLLNVPDSGEYTVVAAPGAATMSFTAYLSHAVTGALIADAPPFDLDLTVPGRHGYLSFDATAGQTFALRYDAISTTPSGRLIIGRVYGPNGAQLTSFSTASGTTFNLPNLAAGTHTVLLSADRAAPSTLQVRLATGIDAELATTGTSQSYAATVLGQGGYFTFQATAGDDLGLALTGISYLPPSNSYATWVTYYRPNGAQLGSFYCYPSSVPGCSASVFNVPNTGTYTLVVGPPEHRQAAYTLTLSHAVTGTLTPGAAPLPVDLTAPGRRGYLSFSATAGQSLTLNLSSIATTPSNKQITARVYNPSGTEIGSVSGTSSATLNLSNLTAGTHMVLLYVANAAAGTVQVGIP